MDGQTREDFIGFFDAISVAKEMNLTEKEPKLTGVILGEIVNKICVEIGLNMKNCVSICTDGASSIVSKKVGAVKTIKKYAPLASHSYCLSHLINLSISTCESNRGACYVIKTIKKCYKFFM